MDDSGTALKGERNPQSVHVTLLAGGISAEREVSLQTGAQIAAALERSGCQVFKSDISPDDLSALDHRPCDVVFPALHGTFGEDGQLQKILEDRGLTFVGSGSQASKLAMDKAAAKSRLLEQHIATPPWQVVYAHKFKDSWTPISGIGYPCVIKPVSEGSSVDCAICASAPAAREHLAQSLARHGAMLVEKCIVGPELTVGVIDGQALPTLQIRPLSAFYDYQAKYVRDDTEYLFDIALPAKTLEAVRRMALEACRAMGVRHVARVDIMVDGKTGEPFVLEVNTMPGFTTHSLVPKAAARAGIGFDELCGRLVNMAIRDHAAAERRPETPLA